MTISTTANRQDYTGDGCTLAFAYTFKIPATSDLDVFVAGTQKTLTADYTVSGAGSATGGTVTFIAAPGCGLAVAIVRDVAYTQATAYPENNPFPAASHEDALDKLTMLVQQAKELATRAWRFAAGSVRAAAGYVVDEPKGGTYPRVKADCTGIEFVTLTACGTYADPVTTKGDLIVGSASGTQERLGITSGFTLVASPDTGRPSWQPGLSVQLTNTVDAALTAGDVVAIGASCDRTVITANTQGCTRVFVVAPAAIGDDCLALFHLTGLIQNVKASGAIARGQYVRKSATAQAVEDAGVAAHVSGPPVGTLGVAVTAAAANLVDVLFGNLPAAGRKAVMTFAVMADQTAAAGSTVYLGPAGHAVGEDSVTTPVPFKSIVRNLVTRSGSAPGAGETYAYTVRNEKANTVLTVTVSNPNTNGVDITRSTIFLQQDRIDIALVTSGGAVATVHIVSVELEEIP